MSHKSLKGSLHRFRTLCLSVKVGPVFTAVFFEMYARHSVCNVAFGTFLKALDVWAMGVTLYCFVFGKASLRIFYLSVIY